MSVVLYVFGAALLAWSAFLMMTGGMVATLDIAAGLAGSGVFALGLGAVVAALERLTRAVATTAQLRALPGVVQAAAPREEPPAEAPRAPEPRPFTPPPARPVVKAQKPRREPTPDETAAVRAPEVAPPVVVAPILGGGLPRIAREEEQPPLVAERSELSAEVVPPGEPEIVTPSAPRPEPAPPPAPIAEPAPEPARKEARVPEWLARARARREAKALDDGGVPSAAPDLGAPVAPIAVAAAAVAVVETAEAFEPSPEPHPLAEEFVEQPAAPAAEDAETAAYDPSEVVVREGEHNGVMYRFFEDGSIEAQTEHGARRFASIEDLRTTILAARGRLDDELDETRGADVTAPVPDDVSEPAEPAAGEDGQNEPQAEHESQADRQPGSDAADAAEAAAETHPAPEPEDPFEAALAALEGGPRDTARPSRGDRPA